MERLSDIANIYAAGLGSLGGQLMPSRLQTGQMSAATGAAMPGLGQAADELMNSTGLLHQMVSELEALLENAGLLHPAPPQPAMGAMAGDKRLRVSDTIRAASTAVLGAVDRLREIRNRVDV
jgi:hypothetical protein